MTQLLKKEVYFTVQEQTNLRKSNAEWIHPELLECLHKSVSLNLTVENQSGGCHSPNWIFLNIFPTELLIFSISFNFSEHSMP